RAWRYRPSWRRWRWRLASSCCAVTRPSFSIPVTIDADPSDRHLAGKILDIVCDNIEAMPVSIGLVDLGAAGTVGAEFQRAREESGLQAAFFRAIQIAGLGRAHHHF